MLTNTGIDAYDYSDISSKYLLNDRITSEIMSLLSIKYENRRKEVFASKVRNMGALLYFEKSVEEERGDLLSANYKKADCAEAYLFFKDYLVICRLPYERPSFERTGYIASQVWHEDYEVREPIAIPYLNIENITIKQDEMVCSLTIDFGNNRTVTLDAGCHYHPMFKYKMSSAELTPSVYTSYTLIYNSTPPFSGVVRHKYYQELSIKVKQILENKMTKENRASGIYSLLGLNLAADSITEKSLFDDKETITKIVENRNLCIDNDVNQEICSMLSEENIKGIEARNQELLNTVNEKAEDLQQIVRQFEETMNSSDNTGLFGNRRERKMLNDLRAERIKKQREYDEAVSELNNYDPYSNLLKLIERIPEKTGILKRRDIISTYEECKEKGILDIDNPDSKLLFEMTCKKNNIPGFASTRALLQLGQSIENKNDDNAAKELKRESREARKESNRVNKELSSVVGIEKYKVPIITLIENYTSIAQLYDKHINLSEALKVKQKKGMSWAVAGGIASGIAGPGVGAAVAINKMNEDKRQAELSKVINQELSANQSHSSLQKSNYQSRVDFLLEQLHILESKLCDTDHSETYSEYYSFNIVSDKFNDDGTIDVTVSAREKKPFNIGPVDIYIDGSVLVQALDNGAVVGEGYLLGEGHNSTDEYRGFMENKGYIVNILPLEDNYNFTDNKKIRYRIIPLNFWMIEKYEGEFAFQRMVPKDA